MLRLILSPLILAAILVSLSGCESLKLIIAGNTTPSPELTEPELIKPKLTKPKLTGPKEPKKPQVTLLNPDNYQQAKALHLQVLIQNHIEPLAMKDVGYYMDVQNAQLIQLLSPTSFDIPLRE